MLGYTDVSVGKYSSGMMQKLSVAASLVGRPSLVIWDEPTSNVDAIARRQIAALVERLSSGSEGGTRFLITSHVPAEFDGVADWVGVMASGRFVTSGRLTDLAEQSRSYEATSPEPYRLAEGMARRGICIDVRISGETVNFVSVPTPGAAEALASTDSLVKATGRPVSSLRKLPKAASAIYEESLREA